MAKTYINVRIQDTRNVIFEGPVDRINTFNEVGPLDIYPMHANFISILRRQLTLYKDRSVVKELKFEQAIMKVKKDAAQIFLGLEGFLLDEGFVKKNDSNPTEQTKN